MAVEDSRDDSAPALSTETLEQNRCVLFLSIASDSRIPGDFLFLKQRDEMRIKSIPITPMSWDVFKAAPKKHKTAIAFLWEHKVSYTLLTFPH